MAYWNICSTRHSWRREVDLFLQFWALWSINRGGKPLQIFENDVMISQPKLCYHHEHRPVSAEAKFAGEPWFSLDPKTQGVVRMGKTNAGYVEKNSKIVMRWGIINVIPTTIEVRNSLRTYWNNIYLLFSRNWQTTYANTENAVRSLHKSQHLTATCGTTTPVNRNVEFAVYGSPTRADSSTIWKCSTIPADRHYRYFGRIVCDTLWDCWVIILMISFHQNRRKTAAKQILI